MSVDRTHADVGYGLNQALLTLSPQPIVSRRNPTTRDKAPIGTTWVNRTANTSYVLVDIANNSYTWGLANTPVVGALNVGGTLTAGTGLVATTGGLSVVAGGAAITGNTAITGTLAVSSTITATLGNITATAGNVVSTLGNFHAVNGNIYTDAGDIYTTAGDIETTLGDINVTHGDLNMVNGEIVFTAAATGITLPGPVTIHTGAGAPAAGLAVNVGDMYIRTDAGAAAQRIYIATAANTWTNVTCAA